MNAALNIWFVIQHCVVMEKMGFFVCLFFVILFFFSNYYFCNSVFIWTVIQTFRCKHRLVTKEYPWISELRNKRDANASSQRTRSHWMVWIWKWWWWIWKGCHLISTHVNTYSMGDIGPKCAFIPSVRFHWLVHSVCGGLWWSDTIPTLYDIYTHYVNLICQHCIENNCWIKVGSVITVCTHIQFILKDGSVGLCVHSDPPSPTQDPGSD